MSQARTSIAIISIVILLVCACCFLTGFCKRSTKYEEYADDAFASFPLQFISTQMSVCLDVYPAITWLFVTAISIQMLLLLYLFCLCSDSATYNTLATSSFLTNIIGVAEFRSTSVHQSEKNAHYFFAFCTMASFFIIHLLVLMHLWNCALKFKKDKIQHLTDGNLAQRFAERLYLGTFILLISLMLSYFVNHNGLLLHASITLEWILLLLALYVQLHAQSLLCTCLETQKTNATQLKNLNLLKDLKFLLVSFLFTVITAWFFTPPWFKQDKNKYLQTGWEFWILIILGNCVIVWIYVCINKKR